MGVHVVLLGAPNLATANTVFCYSEPWGAPGCSWGSWEGPLGARLLLRHRGCSAGADLGGPGGALGGSSGPLGGSQGAAWVGPVPGWLCFIMASHTIHLLHFATLCFAFGDSDSGGDRDSDMDLRVIVEHVEHHS